MTNYKSCPKPHDLYTDGPEPIPEYETPTNENNNMNDIMSQSCVNKDDKCNYISQPFFENELKDKNKEKVLNNFESMCGLREGNIQNCCSLTSPKNAENDTLKEILPYGFKVQDYMGNAVNEQDCHLDNACVYRACNEGEKGCFKLDNCDDNDNHCKKMNNYYKCKFNDVKTADINEDSHFIDNFNPTCYTGICKNEEYAGWVLSPEERDQNLKEDKRILLSY